MTRAPVRNTAKFDSVLVLGKEVASVLVNDVASIRVPNIADVLGPKQHLGAGTQRESVCESWVAIKDADVIVSDSTLHDHPHPVDASVDDLT